MTTDPQNTHENIPASAQLGSDSVWQVRNFVEDATPEPVNPLYTLARIFRGQWIKTSITGLLLGTLFAVAAFTIIKPNYESEGLVRVIAREPKILYASKDDSRLRLYDAFVSAEATYLQSQPVLERAYDMYKNPTSKQTIVQEISFRDFSQSVAVKKLKGLISVSAKGSTSSTAKQIVNTVLKSYSELHMEQSGSRQTMRAKELQVRVQELAAKQYELNQQLLVIGEEYDQSSLSKAHLTKVTQLEELDVRVEELANTLAEMEASNGALDADTGDMEIKRATLLDRAMADMVFERAKRAADLEKLLFRYKETHPKVATLSASLKVIDNAIENRRRLIATLGKTGAITGGDGSSTTQDMNELHALKNKLTNRRAELSKDAKRLNSKLISLKRINEEKSQLAGMLGETRRILDQVRLESRNSLPGTVEILSYGTLSDMPASDKRKQLGLLGFVMGLGFAAMIFLILRQFSGKFIYSDDFTSSITAANEIGVFTEGDLDPDVSNTLAELQLSPGWKTDVPTVISFVRFDDESNMPVSAFAKAANRQGLKTIIINTSEEEAHIEKGFLETIKGKAAFNPLKEDNIHIVPYGQNKQATSYSINTAKNYIQDNMREYDLILLNTGIAGQHIASKIFPHLSNITIATVGSGTLKRRVKRFFSRPAETSYLVSIFTGAIKNDPNTTFSSTLETEGENHEQTA